MKLHLENNLMHFNVDEPLKGIIKAYFNNKELANNKCTHSIYYRHFLCFSTNPKQGLLKKSLVHQLRGGKAKLYMNTAS